MDIVMICVLKISVPTMVGIVTAISVKAPHVVLTGTFGLILSHSLEKEMWMQFPLTRCALRYILCTKTFSRSGTAINVRMDRQCLILTGTGSSTLGILSLPFASKPNRLCFCQWQCYREWIPLLSYLWGTHPIDPKTNPNCPAAAGTDVSLCYGLKWLQQVIDDVHLCTATQILYWSHSRFRIVRTASGWNITIRIMDECACT